MKIITALENPKTNERLKKETDFEIIGNDILYQEGVLEILEKNPEINLIIISELLSGEIGFIKLIEKIKLINKKIEIIAILKNENEETKNYLISKGVFNIFYNNKITNNELIEKIKNINKIKQENNINEEIENLKKIILEKNNNKNINNKILYLKGKILKKIKAKKEIKKSKNKIISIVGTNGIGKSIFASLLSKIIKNKKILLIDFDILNQSINSIFNTKRTDKKIKKNNMKKNIKNNLDDLIMKANNNIDLLCTIELLFDEKYKIQKNKIKKILEKFSTQYDVIIIDTSSECFFDYTKEILEKSDLLIFLTQPNLIELKKTKNLLNIYINQWNIKKEKINIVFNKTDINSIDNNILKVLFSDFNILGQIKLNNNFNLIINNNLKLIDKKVQKQFKKIIAKIGV